MVGVVIGRGAKSAEFCTRGAAGRARGVIGTDA